MTLPTVQEVPQQPQPRNPMSYAPPLSEQEQEKKKKKKKQQWDDFVIMTGKATAEACVFCGQLLVVFATCLKITGRIMR